MDNNCEAEELLDGISELELKCRAIQKAVKESYFTLEEALNIYKVTKEEYDKYIYSSTG